jgi:hypothetical protein
MMKAENKISPDKNTKNNLLKEQSRRRVCFFSLFIFVAFGLLLKEESDRFTHAIDELFLVAGSGIIMVLS